MEMELSGIKKSYGRKKVLNNIKLGASEGTCIGILGGNGSGKSTLLSILAGVQRADAGTFMYKGHDLLKDSKERAKTVGYVPQGTPLIEELNAWDNLRMWYSSKTLKDELKGGVLEMLGIDGFLKVPVRKMSGGMKKRLAIGCAVVAKPKILLLDEPSSALDLACKENIYEYFESYRAQGGILLIVTHEIQEIELCDRCYIIKEGQLQLYNYDGDIEGLVGSL
jgi:ABC-2 type transport system ATP-binding protein